MSLDNYEPPKRWRPKWLSGAWAAAVISICGAAISGLSAFYAKSQADTASAQLALQRTPALYLSCKMLPYQVNTGDDIFVGVIPDYADSERVLGVDEHHLINPYFTSATRSVVQVQCDLRNYGATVLLDVQLPFAADYFLGNTFDPTKTIRLRVVRVADPTTLPPNGGLQKYDIVNETKLNMSVEFPLNASVIIPPDSRPTTVRVMTSQATTMGLLVPAPPPHTGK